MANRDPRFQNPLSQWEDVQVLYEEILRYDRFLVPPLFLLTLLPMVSAWATVAAFEPAGAWYDDLATAFAKGAMVAMVAALMTLGAAWSLAIASFRMNQNRRRIFQWIGIVISATVSLGHQLFIADYGPSRQNGSYQIVLKGEALVDGIDRFRTQYGRIPARLDELRYGFVDQTSVGMVGYSDFDYSRSFGGESYTLSMPLYTWPQGQTRIVYRSAPPVNATDPTIRYGEWEIEDDGPKR